MPGQFEGRQRKTNAGAVIHWSWAWRKDELYMLKSKFKNSEITESEYKAAVESLDKKYEEMWKRLDGYYQL